MDALDDNTPALDGPSDQIRAQSSTRPTEGDFVTLFCIKEIARWTRQGESTLRRWIAAGKIAPQYLTRPGGKIMMSGDQLARLIRSWQAKPEEPSPQAEQQLHKRRYRRRPYPAD